MTLRPYQGEAKEAVFREWEKVQNTLLVIFTGGGKTIIFASIAEELVKQGKRVLIIAHREELLQQAADKIYKATGLRCSVEKAEKSATDGDAQWFNITVGSVQTLMRDNRRAKFDDDHYDVIIIDEAHHTLADSYRKVIDHFPDAKLLGVTATPDRGDLRSLGEVYETIAFEYTMAEGIRDGFLAPIRAQTIPLSIDVSSVKQQSGDFQVSSLGTALDPYLEQIAEEISIRCSDRKTMIFMPLIATSQKMLSILRHIGINAKEVNGKSEDRAETLKWFGEAPKGAILLNAMLLTEGFDEPSVDCIICLRLTKIRSLYVQVIGRGTRLFPGKENLLILDFLWMTNQHDLCKPANLISEDQEIVNEASRILAEQDDSMSLDEVVAEADQSFLVRREEALAEKLEAMRKKKGTLVDPLQFEYSISSSKLTNYQPVMPWESEPASEEQIKFLEKEGLYAHETSAGEAARLIESVKSRVAAGLSSAKQIRTLEKFGFKHVGKWTFDQAKKVCNRLAVCRWRVPYGMIPSEYDPNNV